MTADVNELSGAVAKILVILSLFILVFTLLTCFANVVYSERYLEKKAKRNGLVLCRLLTIILFTIHSGIQKCLHYTS